MAITFPNSPSSGDTHTTSNGLQYTYDGEKWTTIGTNSAGTWTRTGTTVSLTTAGDDLNVDSGTLFVDSSTNNVGIGTTSPSVLLELKSTEPYIQFTDTAAASGYSRIMATHQGALVLSADESNSVGSSHLRFDVDATERMRIDSSGNLFIGGTTAATADIALNANGSATLTGAIISGGDPNDGGAVGCKILNTGIIQAARSSGASAVWIGYTQGVTAPTSRINGDGSATFAGSIIAGENGVSSSDEYFRWQPNGGVTVNNPTGTSAVFQTYDGSSADFTSKIFANGSATFNSGNTTINSAGQITTRRTDSSNSNFGVWVGQHYDGTNTSVIYQDGSASFAGALSKGSGSFKISHPLPAKTETHHLVHSFIEGPQADLIYRGYVDLVDGQATVNIDTAGRMTEGTFEVLCTNVSCFTSNESDWTAVKGSVTGNVLTITAQDATATSKVSWMVVGERKDQHMLDTEWTDDAGRVITEPEKVVEVEEETEE